MNKSVYSIQIRTFLDFTVLLPAISCCVNSLEVQLANEAVKKKQFFGLFYKPTAGLQDHERIILKMREIHGDLLKELPNFGDGEGAIEQRLRKTGSADIVPCTLKVSDLVATVLYTFVKLGMRNFQKNAQQGNVFKGEAQRIRDVQESFDRVLMQLPFNENDFKGGFSFSDVHQS